MSWIVDLIFFMILVLGTAYGAYKGFVAGVLKIATTLFCLIFAFTLCVSFSNFLESCFGMTTAIARGLESAIGQNETYGVALGVQASGETIGEILEGMEINGMARWFIGVSFGSVEVISAEATPAMLIASVIAKWISIVISYVGLVILIKVGAILIKLLFNSIKDNLKGVRYLDQILGALLGLAKACLLIFIVLLVLNWLPFASLHEFIVSSGVVGRIFEAQWFQNATSYTISGKWFSDFIGGMVG